MGLTDREIRFAKTPDGLHRTDLRDDQVRGLVLRIYGSGAKSWSVIYRRREDDQRRIFKLGEYPGLGLREARELANGKLAVQGKPTRVAPRNLRAVLCRMLDRAADGCSDAPDVLDRERGTVFRITFDPLAAG